MALVNHVKKEINAKIVYFGPAGCGKSAALSYIYSRIKPSLRGDLRTVPAGRDNLLLFDFSPFEAPLSHGYHVRLHIYTLTGAVTNPATWKMTLKGTDGVIIMVNPATGHAVEAQESVSQLRDFLSAYGVGLHDTPAVLQLNSSTPGIPSDITEFASSLDLAALAAFRSNPDTGEGVLDALSTLSRQVLERASQLIAENNPLSPANSLQAAPHEDPPNAPHQEMILNKNSPIPPGTASPDNTPRVTLVAEGLEVAGTTMKIPLEIQCGERISRVVVSVSIAMEA